VAISGALQGCRCTKRRQARQKLAQCVPVRDLLTWQSLALFRLPMHKAPSGATEVSPVRSRVPHRGTRDKHWERISKSPIRTAVGGSVALAKRQSPKKRCITVLIFLNFLDLESQPDYYPPSMHANRFSFAFTYRYFFTGSGEADGVLTTQS
jgi:hypothetical protein